MSTYNWNNTFSLQLALAGTAVGLPMTEDYSTEPSVEQSANISLTGMLVRDRTYADAGYRASLGTAPVWCNANGLITHSPSQPDFVGKTLWLVTATIDQTTSARQTRAGGESEATVAAVTPRDEFAMRALDSILRATPNVDLCDDAVMLSICRNAYRWANAMMLVAANNRDADAASASSSASVDVSNGTATEKLLKSIATSIDALKTQTQTNTAALTSATIKIDNPANDKFEVDGAGAGSINRTDLNDTAATLTDIVVFNSAIGNAPLRITKANLVTALIAALDADQKTALFNALKAKLDAAFDPLGAAAQALTAAKAYTDQQIQNL